MEKGSGDCSYQQSPEPFSCLYLQFIIRYYHLVLLDSGDQRTARWSIIGHNEGFVCNPQLGSKNGKSHNTGRSVAACARLNESGTGAHNQDVAAGNHFGTGVNIAQHGDMARVSNQLTRAQCSFNQ